MSGYKLVLLDLDGTLLDHEGAAAAAAADWFRLLGADPTDDLIAAWFDAEQRHMSAWQRGEMGWQEQRRGRIAEMSQLAGRPLSTTEAIDLSFTRYLERYEANWRAFDDVHDTLADLRERGLKLAVLSNGQEDQQRQKIAAIGIQAQLSSLFTSDRLGFAKPDHLAFLSVCGRLAVQPAEVLHVGDRHDLDVLAPRAVGIDAVHLDRRGHGPVIERARITHLGDLVDFSRHRRTQMTTSYVPWAS